MASLKPRLKKPAEVEEEEYVEKSDSFLDQIRERKVIIIVLAIIVVILIGLVYWLVKDSRTPAPPKIAKKDTGPAPEQESKPAAAPAPEPAKPAAEPAKPATPTKPAAEPAKPAAEPAKPAAEPANPTKPAKPDDIMTTDDAELRKFIDLGKKQSSEIRDLEEAA